ADYGTDDIAHGTCLRRLVTAARPAYHRVTFSNAAGKMRIVLQAVSYLAASLVCAMLVSCAELERAPAPEQPAPAPAEPAPPTPAPALPPSGAPPSTGNATAGTQQRGRISMYGNEFAGRKTASGETFDPE